MKDKDLTTMLEIAKVGLSMVFDEIGEELDLSDAELNRIRDKLVMLLTTGERNDTSNR